MEKCYFFCDIEPYVFFFSNIKVTIILRLDPQYFLHQLYWHFCHNLGPENFFEEEK